MTAKKQTAKSGPNSKATPKGGQPATAAKKARKKATPKAPTAKKAKPDNPEKVKTPGWIKKSPTEYIVATEDYRRLIHFHNEQFGTSYLVWRVQTQVFYSIHQRVVEHFNGAK